MNIPSSTIREWIYYKTGETKYRKIKHSYTLNNITRLYLFKKGFSMADIARHLNVPYHIIKKWIRYKRRSFDREAQVINLFSEYI